jgi:tetratricopeptide (TPR) repeat protein
LHSWHHGYWGGWGAYPAIWGAGQGQGWAANNYTYRNPFWSDSYAGTVNYAQPITTSSYADEEPVTTQVAGTANPSANPTANQFTKNDEEDGFENEVKTGSLATNQTPSGANGRAATDRDDDDDDDIGPSENEKKALAQIDAGRAAFRAGNYAEAQKLAEAAIQLWPEDVIAHEFRALTLFAQQKYRESAASVYAILAGGPGWNEQTLLSFYPDRKQYEEQLAALERFVRNDPKAADAEFLLAYHQLTAGHRNAARAELERVAQIEPNDKVTAELVKALNVAPAASTN